MADPNLKPGWQTYRFDRIAINVNDRVEPGDTDLEHYVGLEHLDTDSLTIRRWGTPDDVGATKLRFRKGDIIFGRRRVYQRKLAVADFDGICSAHAMVLRPRTDVVLPEFLPFFMQSDLFMNRALEISVGSLSPTINWKTLAAQEFPLPPLAEQRRIAEVLGRAGTAVDSLWSFVESNVELWRSTALALVDGAYSNGESRLGKLLSYGSDGPFGSKLKTKHYVETGVRVVRLQNVDTNRFNDSDKAYISPSYYESSLTGYTVRPGDVLVAGLGDERIPPGRACVAPDTLGPAINKADCYCLRPNSRLDSRYLVAFLNSPQGLRQTNSFAQGTTRYRMNLGNMKRMKVPIPSLGRQKEIADILDDILTGQERAMNRAAHQKALMATLLNHLLGQAKVAPHVH